jgi:hypothetical protein
MLFGIRSHQQLLCRVCGLQCTAMDVNRLCKAGTRSDIVSPGEIMVYHVSTSCIMQELNTVRLFRDSGWDRYVRVVPLISSTKAGSVLNSGCLSTVICSLVNNDT